MKPHGVNIMNPKLNYYSHTGLEELYLSYVNDFLTVERFASYYNLSVDAAKSIISRGKIVFLSHDGNRSHFLSNNIWYSKERFPEMRESNRKFFCNRHKEKLLSECSA